MWSRDTVFSNSTSFFLSPALRNTAIQQLQYCLFCLGKRKQRRVEPWLKIVIKHLVQYFKIIDTEALEPVIFHI